MSYRILTKNGIENTNIDGARDHNFNAGRRSGIVKGALNQGNFFVSSSGSDAGHTVILDTCELRLCGHRVVIDEATYWSFRDLPLIPQRYSLVAQVIVDNSENVTFDLFLQSVDTPLIQDNLDKTGTGTYQLEIGRYTQQTDGTITDVVRTADLITGGISDYNGGAINIGNVTTNTLESGMEAEVDVEERFEPEDKKTYTDFTFSIPKGDQGIQGIQGEKGETGATGNGIISISKTGTSKLVDTYTISFTSGATTTFQVTNGKGITKIEKTATSGLVDTYTITFNDTTTSTFQVTNGAKGDKGDKGDQGIQGEKGDQGIQGVQGEKGEKGDKGDPNTLTIGSVSSGTTPSATITGQAPNQTLNLVLPKGDKGDTGPQGPKGDTPESDSELSTTSTNPVQNKVLYSPVTFAESERQKSKNLFNINNCLYRKSSNLGETGTNITTINSNIRITLNPNNLIKVNPNTQYTLSTNNSNFKYAIGQLTSNKTTLGDSGWQTNSSFTIITSSTTEYLGINFGKTDDSEISETDYNNFLSSHIQLEEGSVATDYQPYNGAIVHKKEIADVEHIEIVYDMSSSDGNINLGKTSGIVSGGEPINIDLSKYKKLIVTYCFFNTGFIKYTIDLDSSLLINNSIINISQYMGGANSFNQKNSEGSDGDQYFSNSSVNAEKTAFTHTLSGWFSSGTISARNNNYNSVVVKIEGVY